ncbi:type II secretion system F family protein [Pseudomonas tremae]|uniref:Type II secretion system protein F n=1 Tax=Pseudomonas coronafaciens pv. porri TaxID=83964 RepID=A0ABR5JS68_9PSED|nr:type II secretion system F family protein [Pseudomonas coronafaciens]MCQ3025183.1 type II secretion system F family protein [Pseudomonas tremae]KOP60357.1 type II secretion system protein F [Pseudomonas coronafaciens pv. porri]KPY20875.1 Type II secretion system protein, F domain [Pseudomonas coronafaciens pv. porri]RMU85624.1 Type II secretion system protein, F domain [Pseudomonas coronafaciens pv. porri]RMW04106.1 Type II secretion system protein, F domain [Pseudomonas coronafaciens pv. p
MTASLVLGVISLLLLIASVRMFYLALNQDAKERVRRRLTAGQIEPVVEKPGWARLDRAFIRAGLGLPTERMGLALTLYALLILIGYAMADGIGVGCALVGVPLGLRLFVSWRSRVRVRRMIEQLPQLLDHSVRSLKSGRTLADAVLFGIAAANQPLKEGMSRIERNVQLGVSLPDAARDFAELYESDEFHLFALGLRVNHRYGGNASELMENLIRLIRDREQASRQLRAMTGETRMTALVLGLLPVGMAGYFMAVNPAYLMHMWNDGSGRILLSMAFALQLLGCLMLWRMLRSI